MSQLEPRNPSMSSTEYSNIFVAQIQDLKTTFMNMKEVFKEEINSLEKIMKTKTMGSELIKQFGI